MSVCRIAFNPRLLEGNSTTHGICQGFSFFGDIGHQYFESLCEDYIVIYIYNIYTLYTLYKLYIYMYTYMYIYVADHSSGRLRSIRALHMIAQNALK